MCVEAGEEVAKQVCGRVRVAQVSESETESVAAHASPEPKDTPLVRSIYDMPIPDDPLSLWDRVSAALCSTGHVSSTKSPGFYT